MTWLFLRVPTPLQKPKSNWMSWKMRHVDTVSDMLSRQKEEAAGLNSTDLGTQEQAPGCGPQRLSMLWILSIQSDVSFLQALYTAAELNQTFWISLDRGL